MDRLKLVVVQHIQLCFGTARWRHFRMLNLKIWGLSPLCSKMINQSRGNCKQHTINSLSRAKCYHDQWRGLGKTAQIFQIGQNWGVWPCRSDTMYQSTWNLVQKITLPMQNFFLIGESEWCGALKFSKSGQICSFWPLRGDKMYQFDRAHHRCSGASKPPPWLMKGCGHGAPKIRNLGHCSPVSFAMIQ